MRVYIEEEGDAVSKGRRGMTADALRRYVAEAIGTFAIVVIGAGFGVTAAVSGGGGGIVAAALASGLTVAAMIYTFGHISGAHFNPAVTIAFTVARHFPLAHLPGYIIGQLVGAVSGAAVLRLFFGDVVRSSAAPPGATANPLQAVGIEIVLSFFLMLVITAVATDTRAVGQAAALAIGFTVVVDILFGGPISGASMNPARSFGPALVGGVWQNGWIYWVGPITGATLGALCYQNVRGDAGVQRRA